MISKQEKLFEIRLNDRDFKKDDILLLKEYDSGQSKYIGGIIKCSVTCIISDIKFGIQPGYIVMGVNDYGDELHSFPPN